MRNMSKVYSTPTPIKRKTMSLRIECVDRYIGVIKEKSIPINEILEGKILTATEHYMNGHKPQEISTITGMPTSYVNMLLFGNNHSAFTMLRRWIPRLSK